MKRKTILGMIAALAIGATPAAAAEVTSSALGNVFTPGQPIALTLHADARKAHWQMRDFFGRDVASGDLALTGGVAVFHPEIRGLGYFKLDIALEGGAPAGGHHPVAAAHRRPREPRVRSL